MASEPYHDAEIYYTSVTLFDIVSLLWELPEIRGQKKSLNDPTEFC